MVFIVALVILAAAIAVVELGAFPLLRRRRTVIVGGVAALVAANVVTHAIASGWRVGVEVNAFLGIVLVALGTAALPVGVLVTLSWAVGRLSARVPGTKDGVSRAPGGSAGVATETGGAGNAPPTISRRQVVEATGGAVILGGTGSMLGWGAWRGRYDFQLEEVPVRIPGLPRALDGYVIAQVSDIHAGLHVGDRTIDDGLALVRRARADLLVATGDLVDYMAEYAPLIARKLADAAPRDGVVVVPGNHDHYAGVAQVREAMRAAGVTVLVNENLIVRPHDGGFALAGVDDLSGRRESSTFRGPDLDSALVGVPDHLPRILLSHQPQTVDLWAGRVALQLSGHTHGGQINPGIRPADLVFRYVAGMYSVRGTSLYVNRGFGTVGPPARVGAPPEVTRFVLVAA